MADRRKRVDAVIIGYGWAGAIMAKALTDAGLSVVALERGPARDTSPDFEYPRIADELKYGVRGDLWQPLAKETMTIRHGVNDVAAPYRKYGSFILGNGVGGAEVPLERTALARVAGRFAAAQPHQRALRQKRDPARYDDPGLSGDLRGAGAALRSLRESLRVNRLPNLTPDRRPILTLLNDGFGR